MIEANIGLRRLLVNERLERLAASAAAGRSRPAERDVEEALVVRIARASQNGGPPAQLPSHVSSGRAA
jgi:hypothetical protein